jgi:hypothetical protein
MYMHVHVHCILWSKDHTLSTNDIHGYRDHLKIHWCQQKTLKSLIGFSIYIIIYCTDVIHCIMRLQVA